MYSSGTARWMSKDPLGTEYSFDEFDPTFLGHAVAEPMLADMYGDGPNLYQYVRSNPISYVDPSGLAGDSVSATMEKCMELPYPANIKCLENLLGTGYKDEAIKILQCEIVYNIYKSAGKLCRACKPTMTKKELLTNAACFAAEIAGRRKYLSMNCDCILPGSIARGSDKAGKGHRAELLNKTAAATKCLGLAKVAKI